MYKASIPDYEQDYRTGRAEGYDVTSAKEYFSGNGHYLTTYMKTPYQYDGQDVDAHCTVDLNLRNDKDLKRKELTSSDIVNDVEFFTQDGRNLEDVMEEKTGSREIKLQNKSGQDVAVEDVTASLSKFADAASNKPHVMTYDEYMDIRAVNAARMKVDPPVPENYINYVDNMRRQMRSGDVEFVGEIKNTRQLALLDMPEIKTKDDDLQMDSDEYGL